MPSGPLWRRRNGLAAKTSEREKTAEGRRLPAQASDARASAAGRPTSQQFCSMKDGGPACRCVASNEESRAGTLSKKSGAPSWRQRLAISAGPYAAPEGWRRERSRLDPRGCRAGVSAVQSLQTAPREPMAAGRSRLRAGQDSTLLSGSKLRRRCCRSERACLAHWDKVRQATPPA